MSLPVSIDPSTKALKVDESYYNELTEEQSQELHTAVDKLYSLSRSMLNLNNELPPAPNHISQPLSVQVAKLRDSGASALKKGKPDEAIKLLTMAIEMALKRPPWESTAFTINEVCSCIDPRADAYMAVNQWPEAYSDTAMLSLLKPTDPKNYYRKGRCLQAIQKYAEAKSVFSSGLLLAPDNAELKAALDEMVSTGV
ncbi:translocation protein Sec72p [Trichomonascus vanleenenianus]|uniref:Sec63 complex subunit SEC72 n=1 Tax=Trichomonascus vanleenenianus TaxID=2268995 RepID=UPI003ECB7A63